MQEALTAARKTFIGQINNIIDLQKELTQNYITNEVMNEIDQFSSKFIDFAIVEKDRLDSILAQNEDIELDDDQLKDFEQDLLAVLIQPKEEIIQMLNNFKEQLSLKINKQDTDITSALIGEWNIMQTKMNEDQHQRNRSIIEEIVQTIERFGQETSKYPNTAFLFIIVLDAKFTEWRNVDMD